VGRKQRDGWGTRCQLANGVTGGGAGGGVGFEGAGDWLVWVIICRSAGDEVGGIKPELLSMRGDD